MRIVHVTGYYPPHLGGMEYRTQDLAENSARRGYQVEVITSDIACREGKLPSKENLGIHYLKSFELAHTPIMPALFLKLLLLPKDSVIHLHVAHAIIPEITYLVCKARNLPYVAHIHLDVTASGWFGFLLPVYKKFFLAPVLRSANAVTVLTHDYKNLISEKYKIPQNKITVIPNSTYLKLAQNRPQTLDIPVRLLFVGRLSVQKNIPLLIKALNICIYRYRLPIQLQIAGDGEKKQQLRQMVKQLKLDKYVTFLGNVPLSEMQKLYTTSDIFVLPSIIESFGTVIIEAMACGVPVIATNIPGVRNIVKNGVNGLLVNQNPQAIAKAINLLINNQKLRNKLIHHGFEEVKKYSWETVTDEYENIYRKLFIKMNV